MHRETYSFNTSLISVALIASNKPEEIDTKPVSKSQWMKEYERDRKKIAVIHWISRSAFIENLFSTSMQVSAIYNVYMHRVKSRYWWWGQNVSITILTENDEILYLKCVSI